MGNDEYPPRGVTGRPRGPHRTYTAQTIPAIGNCVLAITRTLGGANQPLETIQIRAFRADAHHRAQLPTMPDTRLLDHPAGLGIIRCSIASTAATSTRCMVAGGSLELRRFYAASGVMSWMLTTLEAELAMCGISSIHIPTSTLTIDSDMVAHDIDAWAREILDAHMYRLHPTRTAFELVLDRYRLPRIPG